MSLAPQLLWFRRQVDGPANDNTTHAFEETSREALCGEAAIVYHLDEIFQTPPEGAKVHDACREAVTKLNRA